MKALVTDAHLRNALAGIRGLGRAGVGVTAVGPSRSAAGLWSRFCESRLVDVDVEEDPHGFVAGVGRICREHGPLVVYPAQEPSIEALLASREALPADAVLPYPSREKANALRDKRNLARAAAEVGLGAPATLIDASAAEVLAGSIAFPCIVKPALPGGSLPTAKLVESHAGLRTLLDEVRAEEPLLVQERCAGRLMAVSVVTDRDGRVVGRFQQAATDTWPPQAGNSSLAISVPPDERLIERAAQMLLHAGYTGLAQLQFIGSGDQFALIDVNLRFYGSLPLALACGVNLPAAWHGAVTGSATPAPHDYRLGVRYRWLEGDFMAAAHGSPRRLLRHVPGPRAGAIWSGDDPVPGAFLSARAVTSRIANRLPFKASKRALSGAPG